MKDYGAVSLSVLNKNYSGRSKNEIINFRYKKKKDDTILKN